MERLFLDFLERAPRSQKPRSRGLTFVGDHAEPISFLREILDAYGEYADTVKLAVSILWTTPYFPPLRNVSVPLLSLES